EEYFVSIYLSIVIVLILILFSTIFLYFFNPVYSIFSFYGGVVLVSALGVFLYNYPVLLSKQRGDEIDASIPYLLPYMKILAKELNISKIIDIIDDFLIYKEIQTEFKRIKYYLNFLGYDIHSSIREAMQSCPSKQLSDLMNDLVTISNSGGDIYRYLDRKLGNLNDEIEAIEKKNLDTLLIYSQIYVVLLLISPLFFTIMTSILDLISASASTTTTALTGTVMTIIGLLIALPFAYIAFMMLIFYSKPLYSRLKPLVQK
ncbi:MAG: type II secretion system F family protein, partial [Nanoarchaeota archaeon]|nr:type II secretion system F family protein [Nanoarchaeota archaeon]